MPASFTPFIPPFPGALVKGRVFRQSSIRIMIAIPPWTSAPALDAGFHLRRADGRFRAVNTAKMLAAGVHAYTSLGAVLAVIAFLACLGFAEFGILPGNLAFLAVLPLPASAAVREQVFLLRASSYPDITACLRTQRKEEAFHGC